MKARRTICAAFSGIALFGLALSLSTAGRPNITPFARSNRHDPIQAHHRLQNGYSTSSNWSGYAVLAPNGSVTGVKGSWFVPPVTCDATPNGYSSFWVGIDGDGSNTVEQIGTDSDCVNLLGASNSPTYYAWFEFYPKGAYLIGSYNRRTGACQNGSTCIAPGDQMAAEVTYASGGSVRGKGGSAFTVTITNVTRNWTFTTSSSAPSAQRASAEWIAEAPSSGGVLPLADFGSVTFSQSRATVTGFGSNLPIGSFPAANLDIITMAQNGATRAAPSKLDNTGTQFSVNFVSAAP